MSLCQIDFMFVCIVPTGSIVLEWNGQSLVDKPFEEVSEILDHSPDVVEILIETGRRMSPLSPNASNPNILKTGDLEDNEIGT